MSGYLQTQCPSGFCTYSETTIYFNDTDYGINANTRMIERDCYVNGSGVFPLGWTNLGINQTWDCLVGDSEIMSLKNFDMVQDFDCTCNSNLCNSQSTPLCEDVSNDCALYLNQCNSPKYKNLLCTMCRKTCNLCNSCTANTFVENLDSVDIV
uniref:ShKT domain-containing protein n=1 Tax=Acrobeloides nanus TaxID=290746 RepID=A0A914CH90_9BILA